ncbi:hypothetical protein ACOME3_005382 [Neoechinorhynchus agilis]
MLTPEAEYYPEDQPELPPDEVDFPYFGKSPLELDNKPRICMMGLRRSGKSSILKVVFHKMSAHETLFLKSNKIVSYDDINWNALIQFLVMDCPGHPDFYERCFDNELAFQNCKAIVFVIDAQDEYIEAVHHLKTTIQRAIKIVPNIKFEVFIHKSDGLSDDQKIEIQRDIHQRVIEDLNEQMAASSLTATTSSSGGTSTPPQLSFHSSSVYDHSVFEAFSKVIQKLIPQLPLLENLLNVLIGNCSIEKAFLFDVVSKVYVATDSSPVDMQTYELCCDMIEVFLDLSAIYGREIVNVIVTDNCGLFSVRNDHRDHEDECMPDFDSLSQAIIRLNNGTVLFLREVNTFVALACIMREETLEKRGMIEHNFLQFKRGIQRILSVQGSFTMPRHRSREGSYTSSASTTALGSRT